MLFQLSDSLFLVLIAYHLHIYSPDLYPTYPAYSLATEPISLATLARCHAYTRTTDPPLMVLLHYRWHEQFTLRLYFIQLARFNITQIFVLSIILPSIRIQNSSGIDVQVCCLPTRCYRSILVWKWLPSWPAFKLPPLTCPFLFVLLSLCVHKGSSIQSITLLSPY